MSSLESPLFRKKANTEEEMKILHQQKQKTAVVRHVEEDFLIEPSNSNFEKQGDKFFQVIKKEYGVEKTFAEEPGSSSNINYGEDIEFLNSNGNEVDIFATNKKLKQLRKQNPHEMNQADVLQWIYLELQEFREQDKMLFLKFLKIEETMREIREKTNKLENGIFEADYDDFCFWPRSVSGSELPEFCRSPGIEKLKKQSQHAKRNSSFHHNSPTMKFKFQIYDETFCDDLTPLAYY